MSNIQQIDQKLINWFRRHDLRFARIAISVVYLWFGTLKLLGLSPATPLVLALHHMTIPFIPFTIFYPLFSAFEVLIGLLILKKGYERVVLPLLLIHLFTTVLPFVFLPSETWQGFMTPTLEGQYIIKNILIIALGIDIAAGLRPMKNQ